MKVTITTCYKKEHKPQVVLNSQALSCIKLNFQKVEYLPLVKAALISQHAIMTVKTILRVQMNGLMIMVIPTPIEALERQKPMKTENKTIMMQSNDKILDSQKELITEIQEVPRLIIATKDRIVVLMITIL